MGLVSDTLGRHRISAVLVDYDLLAKTGAVAREVMTTAVVSVTESTSVDDVRHLLVDRRIHPSRCSPAGGWWG